MSDIPTPLTPERIDQTRIAEALERLAALARVRGLATAILDGCWNVEAEAIKLAESVLTLLAPGPEMTKERMDKWAGEVMDELSDGTSLAEEHAIIACALRSAAESAALSERLKCAARIEELEREVERLKCGA
jgi:hypothetical protein